MQKLMQHLLDGGQIVNEQGDTLGRFKLNSDGYIFKGCTTFTITQPDTIIILLSEGDWKIIPEYTDGIYQAETGHTQIHTLKLEDNKWSVLNGVQIGLVDIDHYRYVTRIGDLPKEPTIVDKIAAVPNDFVPDWGNDRQEKWYIHYDQTENGLGVSDHIYQTPGVTYFRTGEEAQRVIDEVLS